MGIKYAPLGKVVSVLRSFSNTVDGRLEEYFQYQSTVLWDLMQIKALRTILKGKLAVSFLNS